jgi:hypothetical protein
MIKSTDRGNRTRVATNAHHGLVMLDRLVDEQAQFVVYATIVFC